MTRVNLYVIIILLALVYRSHSTSFIVSGGFPNYSAGYSRDVELIELENNKHCNCNLTSIYSINGAIIGRYGHTQVELVNFLLVKNCQAKVKSKYKV